MNIAIDIILCLLGLTVIIHHTVRGFVRSVIGAVKMVVSIAFAYIFTPIIFFPTDIKSTVVAYLLVFSATYVILTVAAFVLDKLCELPVLHAANKLLGFALGVASAYVVICFACAILNVLFNFAGEALFGQTNQNLVDSTIIYKFFSMANIFPLIGK